MRSDAANSDRRLRLCRAGGRRSFSRDADGRSKAGPASARIGGATCRPGPIRCGPSTSPIPRRCRQPSGEFDVVVQCASSRRRRRGRLSAGFIWGARGSSCNVSRAHAAFHQQHERLCPKRRRRSSTKRSPAEPAHEKGKILRETEELVLASNGIVARLGGIHGPGRSFLLSKFLEGKAVIDPTERALHQPGASRRHRLRLAAVGGAASRLRAARSLMLSDDRPIALSEAYRWLDARVEETFAATGAGERFRRKRGRSNKQVSNAKLRALGWEPRYPDFRARR